LLRLLLLLPLLLLVLVLRHTRKANRRRARFGHRHQVLSPRLLPSQHRSAFGLTQALLLEDRASQYRFNLSGLSLTASIPTFRRPSSASSFAPASALQIVVCRRVTRAKDLCTRSASDTSWPFRHACLSTVVAANKGVASQTSCAGSTSSSS